MLSEVIVFISFLALLGDFYFSWLFCNCISELLNVIVLILKIFLLLSNSTGSILFSTGSSFFALLLITILSISAFLLVGRFSSLTVGFEALICFVGPIAIAN